METCRVLLLLFDLQCLSEPYGFNWQDPRSLQIKFPLRWIFFSQSVCQSSKPKLEMLIMLHAALFTFPKKINIAQKTFHVTTLESLVTLSFFLMMCSQCRIRKLWISLSVHLVYRTEAHAKLPYVI